MHLNVSHGNPMSCIWLHKLLHERPVRFLLLRSRGKVAERAIIATAVLPMQIAWRAILRCSATLHNGVEHVVVVADPAKGSASRGEGYMIAYAELQRGEDDVHDLARDAEGPVCNVLCTLLVVFFLPLFTLIGLLGFQPFEREGSCIRRKGYS